MELMDDRGRPVWLSRCQFNQESLVSQARMGGKERKARGAKAVVNDDDDAESES